VRCLTGEDVNGQRDVAGSDASSAAAPKLSIVVCAYNMARELPRTIRSLSPEMQRSVRPSDYEIIVVDNGSTPPADVTACKRWGARIEPIVIDPHRASVSPAHAINLGIARARGELIGVMIDGARLASPGLVAGALAASRTDDRAVVVTLAFHLGTKLQMQSVREGYDQAAEDRLLQRARWYEDGYRLFGLSVFAGSSQGGWFRPVSESNALFMGRALWKELGGFDERFRSPGGGFVNLDVLARAVALPRSVVVTLLGEGTFHQVHGGVATNALQSIHDVFEEEYRHIRGRPYEPPAYRSAYYGTIPDMLLNAIAESARAAAEARSTAAQAAGRAVGEPAEPGNVAPRPTPR
jgi:Glycosyl transferase family 2